MTDLPATSSMENKGLVSREISALEKEPRSSKKETRVSSIYCSFGSLLKGMLKIKIFF